MNEVNRESSDPFKLQHYDARGLHQHGFCLTAAGAGGYNQFGSSNSQTPSVASVASSFSSIASYDVGMGSRGGYGNGYASQGGGNYGAAGGNFLGQTGGGYAVTGYTSLPPPGQQAAPPPPPQPRAGPPQLPSNPTSPFLQYSFAQVPVTATAAPCQYLPPSSATHITNMP